MGLTSPLVTVNPLGSGASPDRVALKPTLVPPPGGIRVFHDAGVPVAWSPLRLTVMLNPELTVYAVGRVKVSRQSFSTVSSVRFWMVAKTVMYWPQPLIWTLHVGYGCA